MSKDTISRFIEAVPQDQADALLVALAGEHLEKALGRDRQTENVQPWRDPATDFTSELLTAIEKGDTAAVLKTAALMWMQRELFSA